ncbi:MAG: ADP-ribosylglycohydrolase family protein, partial [Candidatus Hydrogenedentes bacterium]|nr:ADP-ribosylglycohydrolase family protein [Candidatus Hydrogenedentota bacterium]
MPYYSELRDLLNEVELWADLRHEQGVKVKPAVKKLRKQLRKTLEALQAAQPKAKMLAREPNDLDAIRALRPEGPRRIWDTLQTKDLAGRLKG